MSKQPKVSVIVPVYKTTKYLRKCFDSVLKQRFKDIELIIVSDGPEEDDKICEEYVRKYPNVRLLKGVNKGLGGARNSGIDIAKGKYIAFVDSDDWIEADYIGKMYEAMATDESVDIVQCGTNIVFEKEENSKLLDADNKYFAVSARGKIPVTDDIYGNMNVGSWNKLYKKSLIEKYGIKFPENMRNEDAYFTWVYWAVCQNMYCIPDKLYNYLRREDSLMAKTFKKGMKSEVLDHLIVGKLFYVFLKQNNLFEEHKRAFFRAYNVCYWFSRDNGDWWYKICAYEKAHKFLENFDIPEEFEELKMIQKTSVLKFLRGKFLFFKQKNDRYTLYSVLGIKVKFKRKNKTKLKSDDVANLIKENIFVRSNLYYDLKEPNNKIIIIEQDGSERLLKKGEQIDGLKIDIKGNNNCIIIKQPSVFKDAYFNIQEGSTNVEIVIDQASCCMWRITTWGGRNQKFYCGKNCQMMGIGGVALCHSDAKIVIGENCLFAANVQIWAGDAHTIYDINTQEVLNRTQNKPIVIGNHCWIGTGAVFLKGAGVMNDSVVGINSVVTKMFDKSNVVVAGNPAQIKRQGINWDSKIR